MWQHSRAQAEHCRFEMKFNPEDISEHWPRHVQRQEAPQHSVSNRLTTTEFSNVVVTKTESCSSGAACSWFIPKVSTGPLRQWCVRCNQHSDCHDDKDREGEYTYVDFNRDDRTPASVLMASTIAPPPRLGATVMMGKVRPFDLREMRMPSSAQHLSPDSVDMQCAPEYITIASCGTSGVAGTYVLDGECCGKPRWCKRDSRGCFSVCWGQAWGWRISRTMPPTHLDLYKNSSYTPLPPDQVISSPCPPVPRFMQSIWPSCMVIA